MTDIEKATRIHEYIMQQIDDGKLLAEAFDSIGGKNCFFNIAVQLYNNLDKLEKELRK